MKTREQIDKRTKEYKFILGRIGEMEDVKNIQSVINVGYHPATIGLRIKDINLFHTFIFN